MRVEVRVSLEVDMVYGGGVFWLSSVERGGDMVLMA